MPIYLRALLPIFFLFGSESPVFSCPFSLDPPVNHWDGVNERGAVSFWEKLDEINCGNEVRIPLILNFRSDLQSSAGCLPGFRLFPFDSRIYPISEHHFVLVEPSGGNRYFTRSKSNSHILRDKGGWTAEILNEESITVWPDCGGIKITYTQQKISSMIIAERKLDFIYSGPGNTISQIRDGGRVVFAVVRSQSSGEVEAFEFNAKRVSVKHGTRPIVEKINDQNLVTGIQPSMSKLEGAAVGALEFLFTADEKVQPVLDISGVRKRRFVWDPKSKTILADNDLKYSVQQGNGLENAAITRSNPLGEEFWHNDRKKGVEVERGIDGVRRETLFFASGPLAGKLRRLQETRNGKSTILQEFFYSEKGELIREKDEFGTVTTFERGATGGIEKILRDGKVFAERVYDENGRVMEERLSAGEKSEYRYLPAGGYEKATTKENGTQVVVTFDKDEQPISANAAGRIESFTPHLVKIVYPTNSGARAALLEELSGRLAVLKDPNDRCDLLVRMAMSYTDPSLGPIDLALSEQTLKMILADPAIDDCSRGKAHLCLVGTYLQSPQAALETTKAAIEHLLSLKGENLSPERRKILRGSQRIGFRRLLSLVATNQPKRNELSWRELTNKYGSEQDYEIELNKALLEQKRRTAAAYFHN